MTHKAKACFATLVLAAFPALAEPFAYVADAGSNSVSVIDTATNTVVATVPVGNAPAGVAITPNGTRAYVANFSSDTVSVIDTATNTVVATIPVGNNPQGVAITPDGTRAYVANVGISTISVIDTATNMVVTTVPVPAGYGPYWIAITPNGTRAYVTDYGNNTVSVINTATNTVVATIPVGSQPIGVAITPDGTRAYVANDISNNVSVIDTTTNTVVTAVPVGSGPFGVAITPTPPPADAFQVGYTANVTGAADSFVNITNNGASDPAATPGTLCVNVYAFDPSEEMLACCVCPVTPNGLVSLSAQSSLLANTATGEKPSSLVIKLVANTNTGAACDASNLSFTALAPGMRAWGTTLHMLSGSFVVTENSFAQGILSTAELNHLAGFCAFIEGGLSGHGMCTGCATGGN